LLSYKAEAQKTFRGILLNKEDSTELPFLHVELLETNESSVSDKNGFFFFYPPENTNTIHLHIAGLGLDCFVSVTLKNDTEKIYLKHPLFALEDFVIKGLTASQVVEEAVKRIPKNYATANYAYYSFYREYQKVNDRFKNLIEAKAVVMIQPFREKKHLSAEEAFAIQDMRRSNFNWDIDDMKTRDGFPEMLQENPVYHIKHSSLTPYFLQHCYFHFDSSSNDKEDYHISYYCPASSDNHGFETASDDFLGESYEKGKLIIERESFAFKRIERNSLRNRNYNYPRFNNFIIPSRKYTVEFVGGSFVAEYREMNKKWFLKKLLYSYTNNFFRTKIYRKDPTITENFEWYADSVSRYVDETLVNKFYKTPALPYCSYVYDSLDWRQVSPFYFFPKQRVYESLEKSTSLNEQFEKNTAANH
jgi:hypothetical protein